MIESENLKAGVAVGVLILNKNDGKALLGKRAPGTASENTWCLPGGKLEFGETFEEAAKREVFEETGIILNQVKVICLVNDITLNSQYADVGLVSENFSGEPRTMEENKISHWQWCDFNNLPEPLFEPSRKMIENYLENKFY